jgi:2-oxoglutarate/2-oxoacid ferredoxin oxidoreductase subunit alpha
MKNDLIIGMAGSGGDGIVSAGESLMTAAALEGYYAILTKSFGSQIRGGESSCRLRIASDPIFNPGGQLDIAIALNWDDFLKFGSELPVDGHTIVIYDSNCGISVDDIPLVGIKPAAIMAVPIQEMAKEFAGTEKAKNTVVLGLLAGWFGITRSGILAGIRKKFSKKGIEILKSNEQAFNAGIAYTDSKPLLNAPQLATPLSKNHKKLLVDGNEVMASAAIFAGCQFFSGYPITPSSEIMQFLNREIWKYGGSMLQAEDEIAGIGAAVGASFAGKKSMTATSGPGMSLKTEILGLATIAEIPLVCINVQRGGPSTGIPTKSEQSDLFQAAFSAHGDVVRPVLGPTSVGDSFQLTVEAFNIAEEYQTPVLILSDQEIAQRKEIVDQINTSNFQILKRKLPTAADLENYVRFKNSESGISPISYPGIPNGNFLASGIEHNEHGAPTAKGEVHAKMNEKRTRKLNPLKQRKDLFLIDGDPNAKIGLIAWGSVAGIAREALNIAGQQGMNVKLLIPLLLYPVAEQIYADFFSGVKKGLVVEQSHQGQLYRIIRMFVNVPTGIESFCKSGANPILATELVDRLRSMVIDLQRERQPEFEPQLG